MLLFCESISWGGITARRFIDTAAFLVTDAITCIAVIVGRRTVTDKVEETVLPAWYGWK